MNTKRVSVLLFIHHPPCYFTLGKIVFSEIHHHRQKSTVGSCHEGTNQLVQNFCQIYLSHKNIDLITRYQNVSDKKKQDLKLKNVIMMSCVCTLIRKIVIDT